MKVAVVGSRSLSVDNLGQYLPEGTTEIVSGGARGVDSSARRYAREQRIKLTEFLPDYRANGSRAPLLRNLMIVDYADEVLAFWDGKSHGTWYTINECRKRGKPCQVIRIIKTE